MHWRRGDVKKMGGRQRKHQLFFLIHDNEKINSQLICENGIIIAT